MNPQTRRHFLKTSALSAGALAFAENLFAASPKASSDVAREKILVGSGQYGWGQYYSREGKNINEHFDEMLSAVRDCGYEFLEGFIDLAHPENCAKLADQMRAKGLKPVSIYTGAALHQAGKADETIAKLVQAAKICYAAGFSIIDINPAPIGREKTDAELKTQVESLNKVGAEFHKIGIKLGIHNHMPEMANGARELHREMDETDSKLVGFCYDVNWVYRGGIAPLDCLKEYGSRVVTWHIRQSTGKIWTEDLDGTDIDYAAVAKFCREHHLTAPYSVELAMEKETKVTRSCIENHRRSREFMRKVFGC